jgi:hypothetical protein
MRVGAAEQVVPLEDLVEDDAVHEAAEADPEQDPERTRPGDRLDGELFRRPPPSSRLRRDHGPGFPAAAPVNGVVG